MKWEGRIIQTARGLAGAALAVAWLSGCASSTTSNRKVYDRYAELVAARSQPAKTPATSGRASAPARAAAADKEPATADRRPLKNTPASKPAAAPAAPVAPAPVRAETKSVPPATPPPVAVIAPKPVETAPPASAAPSAPAVAAPAAAAPAAAPAAPVEKTVPPPAKAEPAPGAASAPAASPELASDGLAYVLKVGDAVQIFLRGIPGGEAVEDIIDEDGRVSLPFINEVQAAGMTASDLERSIRKIYQDQDIYRNITVNVVVPTRYYFIQGEVRLPGRVQIMSATRVSQAIAGAGGYTDFASGQVVVKRKGAIIKTIRNSRRLERTPEDDILLEPDDIVEVKRSLW